MTARILVVEDNPANLELMSYLLRAFGYPHTTATDGIEAVALARQDPPDLILCDIQLPRMDGYQVLKILKNEAACREIPLVAVTALAMIGDRERMLAAGFSGYISKPIHPETFIPQVESFLSLEQRSTSLSAPQTAPAVSPQAPARHRRATVLVVDDQPENRTLARALLEPGGYRVCTAIDLFEAVAAATQQRPGLVLSDLHLGRDSGFELCERLRNDPELAKIPFLLISASAPTRDERVRAQELGITLLIRPIDSAKLLAEIDSRCESDQPGN